jgi:hypothetical protein
MSLGSGISPDALMKAVSAMPRRNVLAFAAMILFLGIVATVEPGAALTMAPAVLLLALLTAGVRPGERFIERWLDRGIVRPLRAVSMPRPRLPIVVRPVGRRFASALAMRPPPSAVAVIS